MTTRKTGAPAITASTVANIRTKARKVAKRPARRTAPVDALLGPMKGATAREVGGVRLEVGKAGAARVKRMIYPAGFRWSKAMKRWAGFAMSPQPMTTALIITRFL